MNSVSAASGGNDLAVNQAFVRRDISSVTGGDELAIYLNGKVQATEASADDTVTGLAANDFYISVRIISLVEIQWMVKLPR